MIDFHKKSMVFYPLDEVDASGSVSIHLMKYLMANTKNFFYPLADDNGPLISTLYWSNGHGAEMVVR